MKAAKEWREIEKEKERDKSLECIKKEEEVEDFLNEKFEDFDTNFEL